MQLDLKTALARRKMTVSQLARTVGVHKSTISRLYYGQTEPLNRTAAAIERALGYRRGTIRFNVPPPPQAPPTEAVA